MTNYATFVSIFGPAEKWLSSGHTGTSSLTIWAVMMHRPSPHGRFDIPYDPGDFGRCYELLRIMPEWRARLKDIVHWCP